MKRFDELYQLVQRLHFLEDIPFTISYSDPKDGCLLPINNDDNFAKSLECARPLLRIILQRKGAICGRVVVLKPLASDKMMMRSFGTYPLEIREWVRGMLQFFVVLFQT